MNAFGKTKLVEFFGLPRTGKTTTVEALTGRLLELDVHASIIRERASVCPIKDKMHPLFNFWTALSQMKEYVEACDLGVDVLLADRGILDSAVWLNYKNQDGRYPEEIDYFKPLLNNKFMNDNTILAVYFTADIDVILSREYERRIYSRPGRVVNQTVLEGYVESYQTIKNKLERITTILEVDTTHLDIREMLDIISSQVLSYLELYKTAA